MADRVPITVTEGNDETVELTITRQDTDDDLTTITRLVFYLKHDACDLDTAATTLVLSTTVPSELLITGQTATQILAEAYIPAAWLAGSYPRHYHVKAFNSGGQGRDALYGPVTVNDV